jgi:hypothetical protein
MGTSCRFHNTYEINIWFLTSFPFCILLMRLDFVAFFFSISLPLPNLNGSDHHQLRARALGYPG